MFPTNLGQIAKVVNGTVVHGKASTPVYHVVYQHVGYLNSGSVLVMPNEHLIPFNTKYLLTCKSAGIITTSKWRNKIPSHHPVIIVKDPDAALWKLALWQKNQSSALFIGITGSQGKTTTKEMLAAMLKQKYRTLKSFANNNLVGTIPKYLFFLNKQHQAVILEMSLPNIHKQCLYTRPKIGIVTNVGEAHVGCFGSSLNNIVRSKQQLVDGIDQHGTLVLNADDKGSKKLSLHRFKGKIITFGIKNKADITATKVQFLPNGMRFYVDNVPYQISSWGVHNVYNALAAMAVAREMKIPTSSIQRGLLTYESPPMRLQKLKGLYNHLLINDAYNANPTSMIAGLKVLSHIGKKRHRVAVLGDIAQLGKQSVKGHSRVGKFISQKQPVDTLVTVGPQAAIIAKTAIANGFPREKIRSFLRQADATHFIRRSIPAGSVLYFKASRKAGLERMVQRLQGK